MNCFERAFTTKPATRANQFSPPMSSLTKIESHQADDAKSSAVSAGLRYVHDLMQGFTRKSHGKKFEYIDAQGKRIKRKSDLTRIRSLVIPPAWNDVWICPSPNGHLQATGRDAKGRKQYRYHSAWREVRDENKYDRIIAFAEALPRIRVRVDKDLRLPGLRREKILATIVRLLEVSLIRIGNEEYAKSNRSFGLSTMRNRHADVDGSRIRFHFRGKSGKLHEVEISDRQLAKIVERCQDLPGQQLFQYLDESGNPVQVGSEDVNEYIQSIVGQTFTAKDFRTWAGTVLAALALQKMEQVDCQAAAKKNILIAIEAVAKLLGNTTRICRRCYVHPSILNSYMDGTLANQLRTKADSEIVHRLKRLKPEEAAVLAFLRQELKERSQQELQSISSAGKHPKKS
jgi:DNA topoisomerase-1